MVGRHNSEFIHPKIPLKHCYVLQNQQCACCGCVVGVIHMTYPHGIASATSMIHKL